MQIVHNENTLRVVRFDNNEEVIVGLQKYCQKENIPAGHFTALGACKRVTVAFYDLENKKYLDKTVEEDLEITGITGNVAQMDGRYIIHAHGNFSGRDYRVLGGHIKELIVSATCEIHLTILSKTITRRFDEETGLNLLK